MPVPSPRNLIVVFGATGDLTHRKLIPALYQMDKGINFNGDWALLGVARGKMDDASFREMAAKALVEFDKVDPGEAKKWCDRRVMYQGVGDGTPADFQALAGRIAAIEKERKLTGDRMFYLALPLPAFAPTVEGLGKAGLSKGPGFSRLVIEKPFGEDLESAVALNKLIHTYFDEKDVYRLDHYLGKQTVQNLLVFRFANVMFEHLWNRDRVERVEITVGEEIGVEGRGSFYERAGALKDFVQNHITQLVALTAMEAPVALEAEAVANEKIKVLRAIQAIVPGDVVYGQYAAGESKGQPLVAYKKEPGVWAESRTETFVALRLRINNWRWQGVPFYIRTGKRLPRKFSRIVVTFKSPPVSMFRPYDSCSISPNRLEIALQPNEGFNLSFEVKTPEQGLQVVTKEMKFRYADAFGPLPEAYLTLLQDVTRGDRTLFVRADEIEAAWGLYDSLIKRPPPLHEYAAGTWGPRAADELIARDGYTWTNP